MKKKRVIYKRIGELIVNTKIEALGKILYVFKHEDGFTYADGITNGVYRFHSDHIVKVIK